MEKAQNNEYEVRKIKLKELKKEMVVYKDKYDNIIDLNLIEDLPEGQHVRVAGRVVSKRSFGKLMFLNLYDVNGTAQISVAKQDLGDDFNLFKNNIDVGDYIGVEGNIYITKTGIIC